jgi:Domain of unknown function (DUF1707)
VLRASDADRELIVKRLQRATAEGRLLADELEERLGAVFSARTYGQLDALVADLPAVTTQPRRRPGAPNWTHGALALVALFAILTMVGGAWHASRFGGPGAGGRPQARGRLFDAVHHAHQIPIAGPPVIIGVFATLALCAALAWLLLRDTRAANGSADATRRW